MDCTVSARTIRSYLSHLLLLCTFPLSFSSSVQAQPRDATSPPDTLRLTLGSAIQYALQVSPEVDRREAQQHFAEARSDEAQASRFLTEFQATTAHAVAPGLSIPSDNIPRDELYLHPDVENDWDDLRPFNRIEFEGLQPIWTWGELSGSIRAARYGVAVEAAEVRAKALEVAYRTGEIYLNVLLTEELFRIAQEAGSIVERAQSEVQRLLDEGAQDVDNADLYQVQLTEQEYQQRVVEVTQSRQTARTALARQLFVAPQDTLVLPETETLQPFNFELQPLATYLERGLANRPEIDQARAGLQARQAQVEIARSDYYPKLFLQVSGSASYAAGRYRQPSAYVGDPFNGRSLRAGFGFRQKLNFLQTEAKVDQAEAERNEVRYQQEAARQLVLFEVEEAYRSVITAEGALEAQDKSLQISKEWLRTEEINFDLALGDTENLIDAVRANLQVQVSYYESVKQYNLAVLRLLRTTGTLTRRAKSGMLVDNN